MSDLLIVKVKPGVNIYADLRNYWCKEILKMKETGVVVLPWFLEVVAVPDNVEIKFEEEVPECPISDQN